MTIELINCDRMSARISEAQCKRNQERARVFNENKGEYFRPPRHDKKERKHVFRRYQWGPVGVGQFFQPVDLACLECERYQNEG